MAMIPMLLWRAHRRQFVRALTTDRHVPLNCPALCVWGANTGVGKTLVSAGLAAAVARAEGSLLFLKPVQTGFPNDSDARTVAAACGGGLAAGPHAARLFSTQGGNPIDRALASSSRLAKTLFAWAPAVSPHIAAAEATDYITDDIIVQATLAELVAYEERATYQRGECLALVETAGGVGSPSPRGTPQADALRALRLPALLVGDGRLGGISTTLAAYEFLRLRGHDVPFIVIAEFEPGTSAAIGGLIDRQQTQVLTLPRLPALPHAGFVDTSNVDNPPSLITCSPSKPHDDVRLFSSEPPQVDPGLSDWLERAAPVFDQLREKVVEAHSRRVERLATAAQRAQRALWWPFYQHAAPKQPVTVVESRVGEELMVFRENGEESGATASDNDDEAPAHGPSTSTPSPLSLSSYLLPSYDACASWWTQGANAAAQGAILQATAAAAARYGHVILSGTVHGPALELAEALLQGPGRGWAERVFYSDNGSTAIEVALKMAFRAFLVRHPDVGSQLFRANGSSSLELGVIGLTEAYHGDTLGAMECVAPSPYNGPKQTAWYRGRGLFLDPPTVSIQKGIWTLHDPSPCAATAGRSFTSLNELFGERSEEEAGYRAAISEILSAHSGPILAACIMEPVIQGAGGMRLIDPVYQRALVKECRARGVPVILDEVFTGFWRLGSPTAAHLLRIQADIACYAKLLTGGLVPLAVTLATEEVFNAFKGESKLDALLHGHSYTGHPTGCAAALAALKSYTDESINPNAATLQAAALSHQPLALWGESVMRDLSLIPGVQGVSGLGTVLAVHLEDQAAGYASNAAEGILSRLRDDGVFARPLGNTVYLMCTPMTDAGTLDRLVSTLKEALRASFPIR